MTTLGNTILARGLTCAALRCLLCAVLGLGYSIVRASEPWQQLPSTPVLPAGTVGRYSIINGAHIWYAEWNQKALGTPVLLLHGGLANSNYFGNLIRFLAQRGYRIIAMDSRGHGRSTRTEAPYTYHLMAEDVLGLLDTMKVRRVRIIGWSDGGIIGLDLALNHPNRLTGLFAFGANADVGGLNESFDKDPVFGAYLVRVPSEYRKLSPTPDQWDSFQAALGKMWEILPNFTASQLRSIRVPTTIADGEYDEAVKSEHTRYIASTIPGARLVILPNLSHFAMLQNPSTFNRAVLRFLQQHER
jgi:pimeloyl-ACP methyl ester carboxylesterase